MPRKSNKRSYKKKRRTKQRTKKQKPIMMIGCSKKNNIFSSLGNKGCSKCGKNVLVVKYKKVVQVVVRADAQYRLCLGTK